MEIVSNGFSKSLHKVSNPEKLQPQMPSARQRECTKDPALLVPVQLWENGSTPQIIGVVCVMKHPKAALIQQELFHDLAKRETPQATLAQERLRERATKAVAGSTVGRLPGLFGICLS